MTLHVFYYLFSMRQYEGPQKKEPRASVSIINEVYYPPEVRRGKYCHLGVFRKEYFRIITNRENALKHLV